MRHYDRAFALVALMALASATAAAQVFTPVQVYGQFGQVYLEDRWGDPDLVNGTCMAGQTCPSDPQLLPGLLNAPMAVAINDSGQVVVGDTYNHRVQVFGADGTHRFTIGGLGSRGLPDGEVPLIPNFPGGVLNPATSAVEPRFFYPTGVGIDAAGKIAVADSWNHRVVIYHSDGSFFAVFGDYADVTGEPVDAALGKFAYPFRVALRPGTRLGDPMDATGRLYVLDQGNHRVQVFSSMLEPLGAFGGGAAGDETGRFFYPNDVTYDGRHDQVLVTDGNNDVVQVFTAAGAYLFEFGPGDLVTPLATTVDAHGRICVADKLDRVRVFGRDGAAVQHLFDFGSRGLAPGQFNYAGGLASGAYGRIAVADTDNHRIQILEEERFEDLTPPVTTATPHLAPNAAGWVNAQQDVTFTATDEGEGVETIIVDYVQPDRPEIHIAPGTTLAFPEGVYALDYYAVDRAGNREMPRRLDVRVDTGAPAIACHSATTIIWPPNHKLVPVSFTVTATDAVSGSTGFVLASATSSEPDSGLRGGDEPDDLQGWAVGTADTSGLVRAERSGTGPGRVYTFTFESRDEAGNVATCSVDTVRVPHGR